MGKPTRKRIASRRKLEISQPSESVFNPEQNNRKMELIICIILFVFGVYQSVLFYGHQIVPNSDFPAFYEVGKALLSFELPGSFKRAPVTGILQNLLTPLMPGNYPELKAGWFLNAILHPFNGILLFLLAKHLIGKSAKWFALICMINAWVLYLMTEPIAETTLLFFTLLTIYFIFRRSKWSYLIASIATMVRYECAILILAAFVIDMIYRKNRRDCFVSLGLSFLAGIPLLLWMLGTHFHSEPSSLHYLSIFKQMLSGSSEDIPKNKIGIIRHLGIIWGVGYKNLTSNPLTSGKSLSGIIVGMNKFFAITSFILGCVIAVFKRNWKVLVLVIFLFPYFLIHAYYPFPIPRFHVPSFWIALLISIYGIYEGLKIVNQKFTIPKGIIILLQLLLTTFFTFWFFKIIPNLKTCANLCPKAVMMPWMAIAVLFLFLIPFLIFRYKGIIREFCIISIMLVIIIFNHLNVAVRLNTGTYDAEFKMLADWYQDEIHGQEKLATTMVSVLNIYLPSEMQKNLVNLREIKGENLLDYAIQFKEKEVTYIAWDLRIEKITKEAYYNLGHLNNLRGLKLPQDNGPYKFVTQIKNGKNFVNIFKLEDVNSYLFNTDLSQYK
ncbi:MAG: hypothetical protein JXA96_03960 [Sedimentisphaerales bacterium]|nr:hypothetical protein [Sedimentisphaerales bacterium]